MLSLKERNDSWQNLLSGIGSGRDKATYTHLGVNDFLSNEYLEQLYLNDDIAARICDLLPYEMLRQGFSVKVNEEEFKREGLSDILRDALVKSRIFGAAFIYVGVDDGLEQDHRIAIHRIRAVRFLNVLTTKDLSHQSFYADPNSDKFGACELYRLNVSSQNKAAVIHESRLIPFFGTSPLNQRQFPPSILQRIYPVLKQFHTAWQSIGNSNQLF